MNMEVEQKAAENLSSPSIADGLSGLRVEKEQQGQEMTEEWKIKQVLKAIEEAARE